MRNPTSILSCLLLGTGALLSQPQVFAEAFDREVVAIGSYPDLTVDRWGNVHLVYLRGDALFYKKRSCDQPFWSEEQNTGLKVANPHRSDPDVVVDSAGNPHVMGGSGYAYLKKGEWLSLDPGVSRDTALAIDADDNLYVCQRGGGDGGFLGLKKRAAGTDHFVTLSDPDVSAGFERGPNDHVYGHVFASPHDRSIHVVYRHGTPSASAYRYSDDGGKTWQGGGFSDTDREAPSGLVSPDGTVWAVNGAGELFRLVGPPSRWESMGQALEAGRRDLPSIAADGQGNVYVAGFGGHYNIRSGEVWEGERLVDSHLTSADRLGFVDLAGGPGRFVWATWEMGAEVNKESIAGNSEIWVGRLRPEEEPSEGDITQVGLWSRFEENVPNSRTYDDPFREVELAVTYTRPDGTTVSFWGFWDGERGWKIRFMPDQPGLWKFAASFSDGSPGLSGRFDCVESQIPGMLSADESNPLWFGFKGGGRTLIRSFHVGDRLFAGNWPGEKRKAFLDWAGQQGYNLLSIASHYLNRESEDRGKGWDTPDLWPLNPGEYQRLEEMMDDLASRRMMIFPFAGFFGKASDFPRDPAEQQVYLKYTLARFGPYWNILFNVAGPEPNLMGQTYLGSEDVVRLGKEIRRLDIFGHPVSVHNRTGDDPYRDWEWEAFGTLQGPKITDRDRLYREIWKNHHAEKPLYAQETLWPGNVHHKELTDLEEVRKNAYVLLMGAAAINYADMNGNSSTGFSGSMELAEKDQSRHDLIKEVWDFFESVPFQRLAPRRELASSGYCLADPGSEYLVYLESGGVVDVAVENGPFVVQWINAADPLDVRYGDRTVDGRGLKAPGKGDWLLRLRRETAVFSVGPNGSGTLLGGKPFLAVGLRVSNALLSDSTAGELLQNLDRFQEFGVNTLSVFLQGSRFGNIRGYRQDGDLDPLYARRLGRIIEAAAERNMVVLVGCLYYGTSEGKWIDWDQSTANRAVANTVAWLKSNGYRNVLVDVNNEQMADFDDEQLIAAGKAVDSSYVIGTSGKVTPPNADLSLHLGRPDVPGKTYIQSEGTMAKGYWGAYSKKEGFLNYINIGLYSRAMKQEMLDYTDSFLEKGLGFLFASTWLQCVPPEGPNHRAGGLGTESDPGILWWLEHVQSRLRREVPQKETTAAAH